MYSSSLGSQQKKTNKKLMIAAAMRPWRAAQMTAQSPPPRGIGLPHEDNAPLELNALAMHPGTSACHSRFWQGVARRLFVPKDPEHLNDLGKFHIWSQHLNFKQFNGSD